MIRNKKTIFWILYIFLFLVSGSFASNSQNNLNSSWEIIKQSNGITLSYRWILDDNNDPTREMKAEFIINAEMQRILPQFINPDKYIKWAVGIRECEIEKIDENNWINYTLIEYPWPFKKKDIVTNYSFQKTDQDIQINVRSKPSFIPEKDGITRINHFKGFWHLISLEKGKTFIEYIASSNTKPLLPRFIQDPIVQDICIGSLCDLKRLAEEE